MPALHAWDLAKSSALMINKRVSSGYPNKRLVWLLCDWVIVPVSLVSCFACSILVVLLSIKHFVTHGNYWPTRPLIPFFGNFPNQFFGRTHARCGARPELL